MIRYEIKPALAELTPYEPLAGEYDIRLDANENFSTLASSPALSAALQNIQLNRYPDPYADAACEAFAAFYNLPRGLVTAGNGSDDIISLLISAFLPRGGRVITLAPDFSMYGFYGNLSEMSVCAVSKDEELNADVPAVLDYIYRADSDVKSFRHKGGTPPAYNNLLIFSNPCNPTGRVVPRDDVLRLAREANSLVVADEAYMDFYTDGVFSDSVAGEVDKFENLVVLKTASKAAGAAAIRLGFAVANEKITKALRAAKSPYNVNALTNAAGAAVYGNKKELHERINAMRRETAYLCKNLKLLKFPFFSHVYETCANFVLVATPHAAALDAFLRSRSIAVRAFPSGFADWKYNKHGFLRITAGDRRENDILLENLQKFEVI